MMKKSNKQVTETKTSRTIYGNKISISVKCVAYKQILFDKRFWVHFLVICRCNGRNAGDNSVKRKDRENTVNFNLLAGFSTSFNAFLTGLTG